MMATVTLGDGTSGGRSISPPPVVGASLIAVAAVVLVVGVAWLNRGGQQPTDRVAPTADGVTRATDPEGDPVEIPPSQPAVAVTFGPGGEILRPDPVRARVIDETGAEVLVPLPPNTTVDTVTGAIVPTSPGTTPGGTGTPPTGPDTTRPGGTTPWPPSTTTTEPPTTTSTTTTEPPTTTTTEPPTTTTTVPPTTDPTDPPAGAYDVLGGLLP